MWKSKRKWLLSRYKHSRLWISYKELSDATDRFNRRNIMSKDISSTVYRGRLGDVEVAVSWYDRPNAQTELEVKKQLDMHEIFTGHPNLVELKGVCCRHGEIFLVFPLAKHGTLSDWLQPCRPWRDWHGPDGRNFGDMIFLAWDKRELIAWGIAAGLHHLHTGLPSGQIYHLDVKPHNIWLDGKFTPKIGDYFISKFCKASGENYYPETTVRGTWGYIEPEMTEVRFPNSKNDVFSYGVVLLQLVSGRRASEDLQSLYSWARLVAKMHDIVDLIDKDLLKSVHPNSRKNFITKFRRIVEIALCCTEEDPDTRPEMIDILCSFSDFLEVRKELPACAVPHLESYNFRMKEVTFTLHDLAVNLINLNHKHSYLAEQAAQAISDLASTGDPTMQDKISGFPTLLESLGASLSKNRYPVLQTNAAGALANLALGNDLIKEKILNLPGVLDDLVKSVNQNQNSDLAEHAAKAVGNLAAIEDSTAQGKIACFPTLLESLGASLSKGQSSALQRSAAVALANLALASESSKQNILNLLRLPKNLKEDREVQLVVARLFANLACTKDDAIRCRLVHLCEDRLAYCFVQQENRELQMETARAFANLTFMKDETLRTEFVQVPVLLNALAKSLKGDQNSNPQAQGEGEVGESDSVVNDEDRSYSFQDKLGDLQVDAARVLTNWAISKDDSFEGEIFCSPGMLVWASKSRMKKSTTAQQEPYSQRSLRSDIKLLGLATWEEEYNHQQIFALYNVGPDKRGIDFVFFHAKAMATLFGAGLEHAIVSVVHDPALKILIQEIGYGEWEDVWLDCNSGCFNPLMFWRLEESSSGSGNHDRSGSLDRSTLCNFKCGDGERSINFELHYERWIVDLVQYLQRGNGIGNSELDGLDIKEYFTGSEFDLDTEDVRYSTEDKLSGSAGCSENDDTENHVGSSHGDSSENGQGRGSGVAHGGDSGDAQSGGSGNGQDGGNGDAHSGDNGGQGGGTGDAHSGGSGNGQGDGGRGAHGGGNGDADGGDNANAQNNDSGNARGDGATTNDGNGDPSKAPEHQSRGKVVVDVQLKRKSAFYKTSDEGLKDEIGGEVTAECLSSVCQNSRIVPNLRIEFLWVSKFQRKVNVDFKVHFNISNTRTNEFGWYQNDLQISFSCEESEESQKVIKVDDKIISEMREVFFQTTEKVGESTSNNRNNLMSGLLGVGFPPVKVDFQFGRGNKIQETANKGVEVAWQSYHHCLAQCPTFVVIPTNKENDLSYRASHLFSIEPAGHWENKRSSEISLTGLYANLTLAVGGEWELITDHDDEQVKFKFEAAKKLSRCTNPGVSPGEKQVKSKPKFQSLKGLTGWVKRLSSSGQVPEPPGDTELDQVWQGLTRELIFDHNFEKFFGELKSTDSYRIRDPLGKEKIHVIVEVMAQCFNRVRTAHGC